jgi:hypothetical protein
VSKKGRQKFFVWEFVLRAKKGRQMFVAANLAPSVENSGSVLGLTNPLS